MAELYREKAVVPQVVCLGRKMKIAPGATRELSCPKTSILNVAFRIRTTGPVHVTVEEAHENGWGARETLEALEGETVWHIILKKATFRLRLTNPSDAREVVVSVDVNLPRTVVI